MNGAHLHLIFVHLPIVLTPFALVVLILSLLRANLTLRNTALITFLVSAIFAFIAFQLGESAEDIVKKLPGVLKSTIHDHEEAGEFAIWISIILGVLSIVTLYSEKLPVSIANKLPLIITFIAALGSLAYARTANLGGMIRHPEAYDSVVADSLEQSSADTPAASEHH